MDCWTTSIVLKAYRNSTHWFFRNSAGVFSLSSVPFLEKSTGSAITGFDPPFGSTKLMFKSAADNVNPRIVDSRCCTFVISVVKVILKVASAERINPKSSCFTVSVNVFPHWTISVVTGLIASKIKISRGAHTSLLLRKLKESLCATSIFAFKCGILFY